MSNKFMKLNRRSLFKAALGTLVGLKAAPLFSKENFNHSLFESLGWNPNPGKLHVISKENGSGSTRLMVYLARRHLELGNDVYYITRDSSPQEMRKIIGLHPNLYVFNHHPSLKYRRNKERLTIIVDSMGTDFKTYSNPTNSTKFVVYQTRRDSSLDIPLTAKFQAETTTSVSRTASFIRINQLKNRTGKLNSFTIHGSTLKCLNQIKPL